MISVPNDGDRRFRRDRDQFIAIPGTVITMPRNDFHKGVALDITEGKLISEGNLGDRVPTRRSSKRKIKEVLRLRFELGLGSGRLLGPVRSAGAVHNYLKKAAGAGMQWPLPERWVRSARLIRRFIDPRARFVFASEDDKPPHAVPYDMYERGFGHRGEDCTFETLIKAFGVRDKRVGVIAEIVHDADLFDEKFGRKEGFGVDEIMKGWARQGLSNHELLARGVQLSEGL